MELMKQYGFDYTSAWLNTMSLTMLKVANRKTIVGAYHLSTLILIQTWSVPVYYG